MTADISFRREKERFQLFDEDETGKEISLKHDIYLSNIADKEKKCDEAIRVPVNVNDNPIAANWPGYLNESLKMLYRFKGNSIVLLANSFFNVLKRRIVREDEPDLKPLKQRCFNEDGCLSSTFEHDVDIDYDLEVKTCKRIGDHKQFIPITEFSIEKLPENYQDNNMVETIRLLAELTVQITVRVQGESKSGSGKVIDVVENKSEEQCPCRECKKKPKASKTWWKVLIVTSTHVVSDQIEAKNAKSRLFFSSRESTLVSLNGNEVFKSSTSSEVCRLVCVTCDRDLADRLNTLLDRFTSAYETAFDKFWDVKKVDKLVVIVSHPHGLPQTVSIGQSRKTLQTGQDQNVLTYTNVTCPGSTGAFLYII